MSRGGPTESNVRSFEAFLINNYTKYLIIKLSLLKRASKKSNNEIITQSVPLWCVTRVAHDNRC
jgi:hypothetical protein